jgi:alpha-tubulin suppressor-like RCC1 family protein
MAAIKTDGTLWTWGWGGEGAIGNRVNANRSTPVTTFAGGTNWKQVSAGGLSVAAIKTDGTLWTWGTTGTFGGLGINISGFGEIRNTPVTTFAGGTNWKQVSCGGNHTMAIKTDGSLWTWGANDNGSLGISDTNVRITPVTTFAGGTNWKQVSCGRNFTAAIKTDGSLWTWGLNDQGQLGVNNTTQRLTPVTTIVGGNNWKFVNASNSSLRSTGAIKTDGSLWTWGAASTLGAFTSFPDKLTPVTTFSGGTNWKEISMSRITIAIKTDGTLWETSNDFTTFRPVSGGGNNWKSVSSSSESATFIGAIRYQPDP